MKSIIKHKFIFSTLLIAVVIGIGFAITGSKKVSASFNANYIMDDYIFENSGTLNAAQIDAFLNAFPNSCISQNANSNGNSGFRTANPTGWSVSEPNNHGYTFGGNVTAGQAIYNAAQIYHLNPEVILATLQKEQSLVTGSAGCHYEASPSGEACHYSGGCVDIGMSYACPGGCNDSYKGFSLQLIAGSWLLRFAQERSRGITTGYVGYDTGDSSITYSGARVAVPYTLADGTAVTVQTGATGSLYYYTPFTNGNSSFLTIFETWFGPATGQGYQLVKSSACASACAQYVVYGTIKQYVSSGAVKTAWGLPDTPVDMDPNALNTYSNGPDLGVLATLNTSNTGTVYFMDGGKRYKIATTGVWESWNFAGMTISNVSAGLFTNPSDGGDLNVAIKNPTNSTYYMLDGANGSGLTVIRPFLSDTVRSAWIGSLGYMPISTDYFDNIDNAIGSTISTTKVKYGASNFQIIGGQKLPQTTEASDLYPGTATNFSAATLKRLNTAPFLYYYISTPGDDFVYLVDGGTKHKITSSNAFVAWAAPGQTALSVSNAFFSLIPSGSDIGSYFALDGSQLYIIDRNKKAVPASLATAYGGIATAYSASTSLLSFFATDGSQATTFIKGASTPQVYLLNDSSQKQQIEWPDKLTLWAGNQYGVTIVSDYVISAISSGSSPSVFVSDGATEYVMDNGKKWTVDSTVKSAWGLSGAQQYTDGTLDRFTLGGALDTKIRDDAGGYMIILNHQAYGTADPAIAGMWGITTSTIHTSALIRYFFPTHYQLSHVVRSTTDSRVFVVDNNVWHTAIPEHIRNFGFSNTPTMSLDPALASSISALIGPVVKDGAGNYYVIDGGTKRVLPAGQIKDQWTSFGTLSDPAVDNYFLGLFPTKSNMERAIKGSGPEVYSVEAETKRHILYPDTYNRLFAPFTQVSDSLLYTITNGSPI